MREAVITGGVPPDPLRRSCFDCADCKAAISWWCANPAATRDRGTSIPGVIGCPHWSPVKHIDSLSWFSRMFSGSLIKITNEHRKIEALES